jgi:hypothetical protein
MEGKEQEGKKKEIVRKKEKRKQTGLVAIGKICEVSTLSTY